MLSIEGKRLTDASQSADLISFIKKPLELETLDASTVYLSEAIACIPGTVTQESMQVKLDTTTLDIDMEIHDMAQHEDVARFAIVKFISSPSSISKYALIAGRGLATAEGVDFLWQHVAHIEESADTINIRPIDQHKPTFALVTGHHGRLTILSGQHDTQLRGLGIEKLIPA